MSKLNPLGLMWQALRALPLLSPLLMETYPNPLITLTSDSPLWPMCWMPPRTQVVIDQTTWHHDTMNYSRKPLAQCMPHTSM